MNTITLCHHCHGCSNKENPWSSERAGNKRVLETRSHFVVCTFVSFRGRFVSTLGLPDSDLCNNSVRRALRVRVDWPRAEAKSSILDRCPAMLGRRLVIDVFMLLIVL